MISQAWLTGIQALQLIGIGPCLLLLAFLALALKDTLNSITALLFLLSLSAGFMNVLTPLMEWPDTGWQHQAVLIISEAFPAFAFLLMMQFLRGKMPSLIFWLVPLMPLMGSMGLLYLSSLSEGDLCISGAKGDFVCLSNSALHSLYMVIIGGVIMLLMMFEIMRSRSALGFQKKEKRDQYWLIISLVLLTVTLLTIELFHVTETLQTLQALWGSTLVRLCFVFLMFASFFRTFMGGQYAIAMERVPTAERLLSNNDTLIATQIETLLTQEKLYQEMGLTRTQLAEKLSVSESRLSHIINAHFGCNFNILLNKRRVAEAKERLSHEPKTQITVIAFEVGFNSIATFNRVFKEIVGISPSEWRTQHPLKT